MKHFSLIVTFILIFSSFFITVATAEDSTNICPLKNSYFKNGLCYCIEGYVLNKEQTKCITATEWCRSDSNDEHIEAYKEGSEYKCRCIEGYTWRDDLRKCVTYTEDCHLKYGEHVIGRKGDTKYVSYCDCVEGYVWNYNNSQCIPKFKAFIDFFAHANFVSFILGSFPILIWFLVLVLVSKKFKTNLSRKTCLKLFLTGILITLFAFCVEYVYSKLLRVDLVDPNVSLSVLNIILVCGGIAITEELTKFFGAFFILKKNKHFDKTIDATIYLIVLALGFALVENILVAVQDFYTGNTLPSVLSIMVLRFIGANLLHILSSGIIGFFWALSLIRHRQKYLIIGLSLGILLHAIFDIIIAML